MEVSLEQHGSCIQPVHKQEPQEEFNAWNAFGLPEGFEYLMHLQMFKHHLIVFSGRYFWLPQINFQESLSLGW
jgi:hypothetical protein